MKKFAFLLLFLIAGSSLWAQGTFIRSYGFEGPDIAYTVALTNDNAFLVGGTVADFYSGDIYPFVVKVSQTGDTVWSHKYQSLNLDSCYSLIPMADGGFLMTATADMEPTLVKLDATGAISWFKKGGSGMFGYRFLASPTADGGIILTGSTNANPLQLKLVKLTDNGDTTWSKTYGGTGSETGLNVLQTADLGYLAVGYAVNTSTEADIYYLRTDSNGDTLWTRTIRKPNSAYVGSAVQTADGGFLLCGMAANTTWQMEPYVRKVDANGDSLWIKTAATSITYSDMALTADGSILVCGTSNNILTGNVDGYLTKLNSSGVPSWTSTFGGSDAEGLLDLQVLADGRIITCGATRSMGAGDFDYYLVLADATGYADAIREYSLNENSLRLSPNPTDGMFTIDLSETLNVEMDILVFDGMGKVIREIHHSVTDASPVSIDLNDQPAGLYYVRATTGPRVMTGKVMVE